MGDRREFLKSLAEAGAVFAGCCLGRGSLRAQSASRRAILGETAAKLLRIV
jgi:hypothetical protein